MRLPSADDPHGDKEGELPREAVLDALRENGVSVQPLGASIYLMADGDTLESQRFGARIGGLMIRRLADVFAIPLPAFYYTADGRRRFQPPSQ